MTDLTPDTESSTHEGTFRWVVKDLSVTACASLSVIIAYAAGYLIYATHMRALGIGDIVLINSQYLEIGVMFLVLSAGILLMPCTYLMIVRRIGTGVRSTLLTKHFLYFFDLFG